MSSEACVLLVRFSGRPQMEVAKVSLPHVTTSLKHYQHRGLNYHFIHESLIESF